MPREPLSVRLRHFFYDHRPVRALRRRLAQTFPRLFPPLPDRDPNTHPFDRQHRVDTGGLIYADKLASGHPHDQLSAGYYATAPSLFHGVMVQWSATLSGDSLADYAFIDVGCGKGRVLMLASQYPFFSVAGVELNPKLARIARRNLARWTRSHRSCHPIAVVNDDILNLPLPARPVVLFLFNSFERELVRMLLERLVEISATRTHPIDLLYLHPEHAQLITLTPRMELLADAVISFSPEDAAADVFNVDADRCVFYRLSGLLPPTAGA